MRSSTSFKIYHIVSICSKFPVMCTSTAWLAGHSPKESQKHVFPKMVSLIVIILPDDCLSFQVTLDVMCKKAQRNYLGV